MSRSRRTVVVVPSPPPRASLVRRAGAPAAVAALAAAASLAGAAACTDVPSDPNTPVSIEFDTTMLPSPSVITSDTLRDAEGNVAPLRAIVRDINGNTIVGAPVEFIIPDSAAAGQTLNVHVVNGDTVVAGPVADPAIFTGSRQVRIVASIGNLQTAPVNLPVVLLPQRLNRTSADSIVGVITYGDNGASTRSDTTKLYSDSLGVRVVRGATADTGVRGIRVLYRILDPAPEALDSVRLVRDTTGRDSSSAAVTNDAGYASRRIRVRGKAGAAPDTVVVEARVVLRPGTVLGPVRFRVPVRQSQATTTP